MVRCPKCHYQRQSQDQHVHAEVCPGCGIAYRKWRPPEDDDRATTPAKDSSSITVKPQLSVAKKLKAIFLAPPEKMDDLSFWPRVVVLLVFAIWGASFILGGINWQSINNSFLHAVILPFHEFGHVLFSPFGRFMTILGGSLFQVFMPIGLLCVFSIKYRDNFAAAIMLWWSGQSFIDISPYILDAEYRMMPLIRGMGEEAHDWGNLLRMTNSLESAGTLAKLSFFIGSVFIIMGISWAAYILYKAKKA